MIPANVFGAQNPMSKMKPCYVLHLMNEQNHLSTASDLEELIDEIDDDGL